MSKISLTLLSSLMLWCTSNAQTEITVLYKQRDSLHAIISNPEYSRAYRFSAMQNLKPVQNGIAEYERKQKHFRQDSLLHSIIVPLHESKKEQNVLSDRLFSIVEDATYSINLRKDALNELLKLNDIQVMEMIFTNISKYQYWHSESDGGDDIYFAFGVLYKHIKTDSSFSFISPILAGLNSVDVEKDTYVVYLLGELLKTNINDEKLYQQIILTLIANSTEETLNLSRNLKKIKEGHF